jgi:hypothetical protein
MIDKRIRLLQNRRQGYTLLMQRTRVIVWCVWLSASVLALAFVAYFGRNVPAYDDLDIVPQLAGYEPITPAWLWAQHNEHRVPLPRLLLIVLFHVGGKDFRAGMFFNIGALLVLAAFLIRTAAIQRSSYADAFLPLIILNWGQFENFLWFWQVGFVLPICLVGVALASVLRSETESRWDVVTGCCVVALPMCGAPGLAFAPSLAIWLLVWTVRRSARYLAITSLLLVALYFFGFQRPPYHPPSPGIFASAKCALQVISASLGRIIWRYYIVPGTAMIGLLMTTIALLVRACRFNAREASGLLAILTGCMILDLGIGWGRAGLNERAGVVSRYTTLGLPLLCCMYFAWKRFAPRFHVFFLPLAVLVYLATIPFGIRYAQRYSRFLDQVERDARAGYSAHELSQRYADSLFFSKTNDAERAFRGLKHIGVRPFMNLDMINN